MTEVRTELIAREADSLHKAIAAELDPAVAPEVTAAVLEHISKPYQVNPVNPVNPVNGENCVHTPRND